VDVDTVAAYLGGSVAQANHFGLKVGGQMTFFAFVRWTGWTLAMAVPRWRHHEH